MQWLSVIMAHGEPHWTKFHSAGRTETISGKYMTRVFIHLYDNRSKMKYYTLLEWAASAQSRSSIKHLSVCKKFDEMLPYEVKPSET
jgi:hypothetical protein